MTDNKLREFRNQLVADINRPEGRWGIHGNSCVDDDYFLALIYVVGRMDELLSHQPTDDVELTDDEIDAVFMQSKGIRVNEIIRKMIAAHEAKKGAMK